MLLVNCKDAKVIPQEYPFVLMKQVSISESGAIFSANVINLGNESIIEHGFVWGDETVPTIINSDHKSITSKLTTGDMILEVNSGLIKYQYYYVRPFIKTTNFLVYGSEQLFLSKGSLPPEILNFQPRFGATGTNVEITGKNFGFSINSNVVKFGKYFAKVDSTTETKIYVKVPPVKGTGGVVITVETAGVKVSSPDKFDLR